MVTIINSILQWFNFSKGMKAKGLIKVESPKIDTSYFDVLKYRNRQNPIEYGIIHCVSAWKVDRTERYNIKKIVKIFKDYGVSSHIIVDRDGTIYELVSDNKIAYHAGKSFWNGKSNLNNNTLGVELVGTYDGPYLSEGFTDEQYNSLIWWVKQKNDLYELTSLDWIGHSDISPGRKFDPGASFDWNRFRKGLVE